MKRNILLLVLMLLVAFPLKAQSDITVTDIDSNTYRTVTINSKVWMAKNLRTTKYNDGTPIPMVTVDTVWVKLNTPGYCWYNNDSAAYALIYGALYNWYTVNTNKLCPTGWHVPTDSELKGLIDYISANGHSKTEGLALKAQIGWNERGNGNNNFGFTALPGGYRNYNGKFFNIGREGEWWCITEYGYTDTNDVFHHTNSAFRLELFFEFRDFSWTYDNKRNGLSVRCVKD